MVISIGIVLPIVDVCSFQSQVASRSSSFGDMESMASMTPMTAAWMPKEMMSEDSDVLLAVSQLAARTLFDPAPKTTEGVAAMVKVLKPKLYQLFGSQSSSALSAFLLIWDEQFQLAAMAGVVVEKLPGKNLLQDEVPRISYLAVDPDLQKKGLGSMLVRHCEDWAAARGHKAIWLFHKSDKERLHRFYSKMGYGTVKHCTLTVPIPGEGKMEGTVQMLQRDATLMRKPLMKPL